MEDLELLNRRCKRERKGRKTAEHIAENALRDLFEKNGLLRELSKHVEEQHRVLQNTYREIEVDLITAKGIQQHLFLEYSPPPFLNIATRYLPHTHVSGDIFKLYPDSNDRYNLFLGDSTGHGVTAALSTIMAHILLSHTEDCSPAEVLEYINTNLLKYLPDGRFMTASQLRITSEGALTAASAGHPPIIIIPADGSELVLMSTECTVLGVFEKPIFEIDERAYYLQPGDKGLLYTDGITERVDSSENMFGEAKLCSFLSDNNTHDVEHLLTELLEHIEDFAGGMKANDDITLIAFEYVQA